MVDNKLNYTGWRDEEGDRLECYIYVCECALPRYKASFLSHKEKVVKQIKTELCDQTIA